MSSKADGAAPVHQLGMVTCPGFVHAARTIDRDGGGVCFEAGRAPTSTPALDRLPRRMQSARDHPQEAIHGQRAPDRSGRR